VFPKATIHLENGTAIEIFGKHASAENPYVQSLKLNGRKYASPWISWPELSNGARLNFNLGSKPSSWGKNEEPPSFDGGDF
jgi:putative alpha-1,2-mannosidase